MEAIGMQSDDLLRIVLLACALLVGLGVLRLVLKLTARVVAGGCLAIILIVAALLLLARAS